VPCRNVVVFAADLLLDLFNLFREKLDGRAAVGANHVVMIAAVVLVFVAGNAVVEGDFAGQSASGEEFQSAIDSSEPDTRIGLLDQAMQLVDRQVLASFEKRSKDGVALLRLLQADATEVLQKNAFCLAHVLARDGRLIVDTFLQHAGWVPTFRIVMRTEIADYDTWRVCVPPNWLQARMTGFVPVFGGCLLSSTPTPLPPPPDLLESAF